MQVPLLRLLAWTRYSAALLHDKQQAGTYCWTYT